MSFTDMMTSSRGPGVIGTVLALVVLSGFVLLFVLVFDEGLQGGGETIESIIFSQDKEIADYRSRIDDAKRVLATAPALRKNAKEFAAVQREKTFRTAEIEALAKYTENLNGHIAEKLEVFAAYKDQYRLLARSKAIGTKYPELKTSDGTVYTNVEIRNATAVGVEIRHDAGLKRIHFEDLPEELQDYYQFDLQQQQDALAAEREQSHTHEVEVAIVLADESRIRAEQRAHEREAALQKLQKSITYHEARAALLKREINNLQNALRQEQAKSQGDHNVNVYTWRIREKERQLRNEVVKIRRLQISKNLL